MYLVQPWQREMDFICPLKIPSSLVMCHSLLNAQYFKNILLWLLMA